MSDSFLCMRLAVPGDDIATSQYLPEKNTNEYRIPSIHMVEYNPRPPVRDDDDDDYDRKPDPKYPPQQNAPIPQQKGPMRKAPTDKDPFYRCNGINVFVHYVKQFPSQNSIKVGATILEENSVIRIGHDQLECNWTSYPIDAGKVLMAKWKNTAQVQPNGAPIIDRTRPEEDQYLVGNKPIGYDQGSEDILIPVNNEVSWEHDFYKLLWDRNLKNDMFLIVTLLESSVGLDKRVHPSSHEYVTVGYGTIKLNNPDGTVRYGTFEIPLYNPPAKIRNHDSDKRMKSSIKVTVSQPLPSMPKTEPYKNKPLKPNGPPEIDIPKIAPPPNRPPEDSPFIPNDKQQYKNETFLNKEGIDYYIDGGRFFPENSSYTRIIVNRYTIKGKSFTDSSILSPDISISTNKEPFFGHRGEIRGNNMDPTSALIFTLDTFDLSQGGSRIIGHAIMPLFLDDRTRSFCTDPKAKSFILQNGDYQIPIFSQFPGDMKNLSFASFEQLEKIPAATLLIRIRKAPVDEKGKVISSGQGIAVQKALDLGVFSTPKFYSEGGYNTSYCSVSSTESIVMEAKVGRHSPKYREIIEAIIYQTTQEDGKFNDDELIEKFDRNNMGKPCMNVSNLDRFTYLDIKYFSEYIPQLGFSTDVTFIVNSPPKALFYVVVSLAPPGRLYKEDKSRLGVEESKSATDVQVVYELNFDSPAKAIQFNDSLKKFYVTQPNSSMILIYEIFEVKFSKSGIEKVSPYGFSFLPVFQYVDLNNTDQLEIYANTSVQQLLIFKGRPDSDFILKATSSPSIKKFIGESIQAKSLEPYPKMSLIVKLFDNQFENIFQEPFSTFNRLQQEYMIVKSTKDYAFNYKKGK